MGELGACGSFFKNYWSRAERVSDAHLRCCMVASQGRCIQMDKFGGT